ncbi:MAG: tetratricopeptide repeat protein [Candidatus Eisenbacteria bacterium]
MRRGFSWILAGFFVLGLAATGCKNPQLSGGILHFDQKRYERARETLLNAVKQEPNNAEAHFWLAKAYAELDSTAQSRAEFDKAAQLAEQYNPELKPEITNALGHYWSEHHNKGLTFGKAAQDARNAETPDEKLAQENFRLALNQFKRARVFDPTKEETPRNMGVMYFNLGQVDSGIVELQESQRLSPAGDSQAGEILFTQYRRLGDQAAEKGSPENPTGLQDAVKFYTLAEQIQPNDADLLFSLGVVNYQLATADTARHVEYYRKAASYFEKTLEQKPDDVDALNNVANLYYDLKDCEKGLVYAQRLLDLNPCEGRSYDLVGRMNDCLGKKNERVAGLVFARGLQSGTQVPVADIQTELEKLSASALRKYREEGKPEEIRTFTDSSGADYSVWFYWTRGKALAFVRGDFKYETKFKPQQKPCGQP